MVAQNANGRQILPNRLPQVAAQSGLYTAFADKHIGAYTIAKGPSGTGVSDYASLEVATTEPQYTDANGVSDGLVGDNGVPIYDSLKVSAISVQEFRIFKVLPCLNAET